jgi:hypothetical protein
MSTTGNTNQKTTSTVLPGSSLPPDTRTTIERRMDDAIGRTWADICAAGGSSAPQNFAEEFSPSKTLAALMAADDEPTEKITPMEAGVPLTDGALRVLALAQGSTALTEEERARLDAAEHRAKLDQALALAQDNRQKLDAVIKTVEPIDPADIIRRFLAGERGFTKAERDAMQAAIEGGRREVTLLSDDPQVVERFRRDQIAVLQETAIAIADNTATRAQRIRWSRFNTSKLLNLLKTTRWADLPLDLVRNF